MKKHESFEDPEFHFSWGSDARSRNRYILYRQMVHEFKALVLSTTSVDTEDGCMNGTDSADEDTLPVEPLSLQLEDMYGPIDECDPTSLLLRQELKRSLQETKEVWCKLVQWVRRQAMTGKSDEVLYELKKTILSRVKKKFSRMEIESYDLNPYTNILSVEHFVLPRKALSYDHVVHKKNASNLSPDDTYEDGDWFTFEDKRDRDSDGMSVRQFCGLGFFDPKFHGFRTEHLPHHVGAAIASKFSQFIQRFPYGATQSVLEKCFKDYFGYSVAWELLGAKTFLLLLETMTDIFWIRQSAHLPPPLNLLIYPAGLLGSICPVHILLDRFWHDYLCLTAMLDNPTPFDDSWQLLVNFMGLDTEEFQLSHWGFPSTEGFVNYCLSLYDYNGLHIVTSIGTDTDKSLLHVFHGPVAKIPSNFKRFGVEVEVPPSPHQLIPDAMLIQPLLMREDLSGWVSDDIQPGDIISCRHGFCIWPNMLSLVRDDQRILNIALQKRMTSYYSHCLESFGESSMQIKTEIPPGSLVAVFCQKEWRRAIVIKKIVSASKHRIYFLDGAAFADFRTCRLTPLAKKFTDCPALGILCHLDLGTLGIPNEVDRVFRLRTLLKIPRKKRMRVTFLSSDSILGQTLWLVQIDSHVGIHKGGMALRFTADLNRTVVLKSHLRGLRCEFNENRVVSNNADNGQRIRKRRSRKRAERKRPLAERTKNKDKNSMGKARER